MLETRYGLKYPFPHVLVHIVDNSSYNGELSVAVADDPSLYGTLVVTGAPIGEDNKMIAVNRSDILSVAYGLGSLGTGDIQKYGQSVTYPMSLIAQGAPVKLMRVTPDDACYAYSCITVEWRWNPDENLMHVRYNTARLSDDRSLSNYSNKERLNAAIVKSVHNDNVPADPDDPCQVAWKRRAFIVNISAGRGSAYNTYATTIDQTFQGKRNANIRYMFTTYNTLKNTPVEQYYASLVTLNNVKDDDTAVDSVNIMMKKRAQGSSIAVQYVNEAAVRELYEEYHTQVGTMIETPNAAITDYIREAYTFTTVDTFDPIFGCYIYGGTDEYIKLPYFQVDMRSNEIQLLPISNRKYTTEDGSNAPELLADNVMPYTIGVTRDGDSVYVGNVYLYTSSSAMTNPYLYIVASINQYSGAITHVKTNKLVKGSTASTLTMVIQTVTNNTDELASALRVAIQKKNVLAGDTIAWTVKGTATFSLYIVNQAAVDAVLNGAEIDPATMLDDYQVTDATIYSFIDWTSIGVGNLIATADTDAAFNRVGATYIDVATGDVYVNDYDRTEDSTDNDARILIENKTVTFTTSAPETSVTPVADMINTEYDIITVDPDSITRYTLEASAITGVTTEDAYTSTTGSTNKVRYMTKDENGKVSQSLYDMVVTTVDTTTTVTLKDYRVTDNANPAPEANSTFMFTAFPVVNGYLHEDAFYEDAEYQTAIIGAAGKVYVDIPTNTAYKYATSAYTELAGYFDFVDTTNSTGGIYNAATVAQDAASGIEFTIPEDALVPTPGPDSTSTGIHRYMVTGAIGSLYRIQAETNLVIPADYYSENYGINLTTSAGGVMLEEGYAGFFDDNISDVEFKYRYSQLMVRAFRGQIDPRIMSPYRTPAKYWYDGAWNTIVGQTILPSSNFSAADLINASTVFTADEKDEIALKPSMIDGLTAADIDVKQAMYDLMIYRVFYGMPEDKRPLGPGEGFSCHFDSGCSDSISVTAIEKSFEKRFTNPNGSWDIGGYIDAATGLPFTYMKRLADRLTGHCKQYTVNKPFTGDYSKITPDEYLGFFPDIDMTDWEYREMLYRSGGNAWVVDANGNLVRKSQRTMLRNSDTSDLLQESNMRTLSQMCYLLRNKLEQKLFEYTDDSVLKTMSDECNNMFSNWVGNLVESLDISFVRDRNPLDGGEIVVCNVDVTFRGITLRIPVIVNVNRRAV